MISILRLVYIWKVGRRTMLYNNKLKINQNGSLMSVLFPFSLLFVPTSFKFLTNNLTGDC